MIVTSEQLIKQYFPEPIETTRELYDRLELDSVYPYWDWIRDAEQYCLSRFAEEVDYKLLPDSEKNFWISEKVFLTLIQSSPSEICQEIRRGLLAITTKIAKDRDFARQYQDQLDREAGLEKVTPKVSKKLKAKYNETGKDAFELAIQADTRLYVNIISSHNFKPGDKIKDAGFSFKLETEQGIPFHVIDFILSLDNDDVLSYRTVWCCSQERLNYGSILANKGIRINLFGDNRKLIDSYDYLMGQAELKNLEAELEEVISILLDINIEGIDVAALGEKILYRYNLDGQAYAQAIKAIIPSMTQYQLKPNAEQLETAFIDAVNKYWECYVLQPDPTKEFIDDLDQMVKDRIPRVALASIATNMLMYKALCDSYFKRSYRFKQMEALFKDATPRLLYALTAADRFEPTDDHDKRIVDMSTFIAEQLDSIQELLMASGQWPSN